MVLCKISAQWDNWELRNGDFYSNLTTFLALAAEPLDQFNFFLQCALSELWGGGIYPNFSFLSPKLWEEFGNKGIKCPLIYKGSRWWKSEYFLTLGQRLRLTGGNKMEKYGIMQDFSSIRQLEVEKWRFLLKFDHIFGPSSGTLGPIQFFLVMCTPLNMVGYIPKFQLPRSKTVGGVR